MASRSTPALDLLAREGVAHRVHAWEPVRRQGRADERPSYGLEAARALGVSPARVFKTLVATVDGEPAMAIVPADRELDLKALAGALGGRRAELADRALAERVSGSVVGGISPLAMRRRMSVALDASATDGPTVFVSAGRRGLQVELAPDELRRLTGAVVGDLARGT